MTSGELGASSFKLDVNNISDIPTHPSYCFLVPRSDHIVSELRVCVCMCLKAKQWGYTKEFDFPEQFGSWYNEKYQRGSGGLETLTEEKEGGRE